MNLLTDRSEPFMLAGMIIIMSVILIVVSFFYREQIDAIIALVGTWMGTIMGYFYGKRANGHQDPKQRR